MCRPSRTRSTTRPASSTCSSTGGVSSPTARSPPSGRAARCVVPDLGDSGLPEWIVDLFARYGYAVVFLGVFLENTGLPVPGETALLAGAALAHFGRLSLPSVILIAIGAAILGDNLGFLIGRHAGRGLAERHGWRVGLTNRRLLQFD